MTDLHGKKNRYGAKSDTVMVVLFKTTTDLRENPGSLLRTDNPSGGPECGLPCLALGQVGKGAQPSTAAARPVRDKDQMRRRTSLFLRSESDGSEGARDGGSPDPAATKVRRKKRKEKKAWTWTACSRHCRFTTAMPNLGGRVLYERGVGTIRSARSAQDACLLCFPCFLHGPFFLPLFEPSAEIGPRGVAASAHHHTTHHTCLGSAEETTSLRLPLVNLLYHVVSRWSIGLFLPVSEMDGHSLLTPLPHPPPPKKKYVPSSSCTRDTPCASPFM